MAKRYATTKNKLLHCGLCCTALCTMNEEALIKEFREHFTAGEVDKAHRYENEQLMGPFKPLVVYIKGEAIGCVDLRKSPNTISGFVELAYIYIYRAQQGYGSVVLAKICDLADSYNLELELDAVPVSKFGKPIPIEILHGFYRKFGFQNSEVVGSNMMTRYPNA